MIIRHSINILVIRPNRLIMTYTDTKANQTSNIQVIMLLLEILFKFPDANTINFLQGTNLF